MDKDITIGDKYHPAMRITDEFEAGRYFERCVQHDMEHWGKTREEAEEMERQNLGYVAGYFDNETRSRVERLFRFRCWGRDGGAIMTTTTDLTMERLDELDALALIAVAKRTEAAERERDALRAAMVTIAKHAMEEHSCGDPDVVAALAQPTDAGGA